MQLPFTFATHFLPTDVISLTLPVKKSQRKKAPDASAIMNVTKVLCFWIKTYMAKILTQVILLNLKTQEVQKDAYKGDIGEFKGEVT